MAENLVISHIVAMADNGVIGASGGLPWHIPEDFKIFKRVTTGHVMVMGRKTYESIGKPLPGRLSVVVTRAPLSAEQRASENPRWVSSLASAWELCESLVGEWGRDVFVIGGGEIFRETLPMVQRVYLTRVHRDYAGDTFYPDISTPPFRMVASEEHGGETPFVWQTWERVCN
jgi:dihydrofolate reductase